MRRITFFQRLWIPLAISLVCIAAIAAFGVFQDKRDGIAERERTLREIADIAGTTVSRYQQLVASGQLRPEDGKREALAALRAMRFGSDGYVVVIDPEMHAVMNPSKPETEGKFLGDYTDAKGAYVYRQMTAVANGSGGGFVDYYTHRPGETDQVRKRSFVIRSSAWNWIFVTGEYVDDIDSAFWRSVYEALAFVAAISIVLGVMVFLVNRSLIRALGGSPEYAKTVVRATASGDLSCPIDSRAAEDSLVGQIRVMQTHLRAAVSEILRGATTITLAMEEVATGNVDLSQRTEEQAAALQQTAASLAQFKSAVADNSANATTASRRAADALNSARQGYEAVSAVGGAMDNIAASSAEVNSILGMIQSVSFQTNILALNAAVEAARAQEHGRGFAVVASEVRALAQRSSTASRDIETLIGTSDGHVRQGAKQAGVAGERVEEILDTVRQVDGVLREIASASEEQRNGVEELSRALSQIDDVTQHNAALVEESAAATEAVRDQARKLLESVSSFRLA
ncbi:methyl-accepting chemotaxis protein [Paraburkholderia lycopersici]|uniref:Methyl-accepting chemotaxis protein n=1 Tax=Paraburkholderia lycopersici TaxID=416944 RepID=A0A1G6LTR4_9BURK|nr:methyl-accepting chemotaxis protein [Paraburkholderia lycopersici]